MRIPEDRSRWVLSENICICWVTARNLEVMIEIIPKNAKNDEKWLLMTDKWLKISHRMKRNIPLDRSCEVLSENIYICWVISKTVRVVMEKPFLSPKNAFFGYKTQKNAIFLKNKKTARDIHLNFVLRSLGDITTAEFGCTLSNRKHPAFLSQKNAFFGYKTQKNAIFLKNKKTSRGIHLNFVFWSLGDITTAEFGCRCVRLKHPAFLSQKNAFFGHKTRKNAIFTKNKKTSRGIHLNFVFRSLGDITTAELGCRSSPLKHPAFLSKKNAFFWL